MNLPKGHIINNVTVEATKKNTNAKIKAQRTIYIEKTIISSRVLKLKSVLQYAEIPGKSLKKEASLSLKRQQGWYHAGVVSFMADLQKGKCIHTAHLAKADF